MIEQKLRPQTGEEFGEFASIDEFMDSLQTLLSDKVYIERKKVINSEGNVVELGNFDRLEIVFRKNINEFNKLSELMSQRARAIGDLCCPVDQHTKISGNIFLGQNLVSNPLQPEQHTGGCKHCERCNGEMEKDPLGNFVCKKCR